MRKNLKKALFWLLVGATVIAFATGGAACGNLDTLEPVGGTGQAIMLGDQCDCSLDGQNVLTDQGVGKCMDGVAVSNSSFTRYYCDPAFLYTKCPPSTRTFAGCPDGAAGGGTGGSSGAGGTGTGGTGGGANVCLNASTRACTTNQTQSCACTTGNGVQECNSNCDAWTTCHDCSGGEGGSSGQGGTGGTTGDAGEAGVSYCLNPTQRACTTNQTQICTCAGDLSGVQTCNADCSAWTLCDCPEAGVGGAGGIGGEGGTGTGGTGGSASLCLDPSQRACVVNQTNLCGCPGGVNGVQTCNADCSAWTLCDCPEAGVGGAGGIGGEGGTGTGGTGGSAGYCLDANARACTTNQTNPCVCAGGGQGVQTCNADCSAWTTCECPDAGVGGSSGTGGTAGAAGEGGIPICQDPEMRACQLGQAQACICAGNVSGTQSCNTDCTGWTQCSCTTNLACHDGELCVGTSYSFTACELCTENVNGQPRNVRCQKGIMVNDLIQWDPVCYPDAEAGTLANDCQVRGVGGKIAVIIEVDPAFVPPATPANQVLGVFGKSAWYIPDAGINQGYAIWGQAQQTTAKQIVVLPLNAVTGVEFWFNSGYAVSGDQSFGDWNLRCTNAACPIADKYTICAGTSLIDVYQDGKWQTGKCNGQAGNLAWESRCVY